MSHLPYPRSGRMPPIEWHLVSAAERLLARVGPTYRSQLAYFTGDGGCIARCEFARTLIRTLRMIWGQFFENCAAPGQRS